VTVDVEETALAGRRVAIGEELLLVRPLPWRASLLSPGMLAMTQICIISLVWGRGGSTEAFSVTA
jgi:hypothetical protein